MFSKQNLYPGINAHLNSWLQAEPGRWLSFHSDHITFLVSVLNADLPPGYIVRGEQSLQIAEIDITAGTSNVYRTRPDALVSELSADQQPTAQTDDIATALATIPLHETFPTESDLTGILIYRATVGHELGDPVTRIELLSPSNKPGRSGYKAYMTGRWRTLQAGINLVEIDYLHELPPLTPAIAQYPQAVGSTAYHVLISEPYPTFAEGYTRVYGWPVDAPLPRIPLPLRTEQQAAEGALDLATAYQRTFANNDRLHEVLLNYAEAPVNMTRYSSDDQQRIQTQLESIRRQFTHDAP